MIGSDPAARAGARIRPAHAQFLDLPFCLLDFDGTLRLIVDRCEEPFGYVVTPYSQHVVTVHEQPEQLGPVYRNAYLSLCDSQIVRGLARLAGLRLPLVPGSDLVAALLAQQ